MTGIRYRFQEEKYRDRKNFKKYMEEGDYLLDMSAAYATGDENKPIAFFQMLLLKAKYFLQEAISAHEKNPSSRVVIPEKQFYEIIEKDFRTAQEKSPRSFDNQEDGADDYVDSDSEQHYRRLWEEHNRRIKIGKPLGFFVPNPDKPPIDLRTTRRRKKEEKELASAEPRVKAIQQMPATLSRKRS